MKISYYDKFCPNCGGIISDERLKQGLPCEKCLILDNNTIVSTNSNLPNWLNYVDRINLKNLNNIKIFFDEVERFTDFFYQITGKKPWSLQLTWTKRVILDESFSIIAPTGVGKTTWGLVMGLYLFEKLLNLKKDDRKIYYILPTTLLAIHTYERFEKFLDNFCSYYGVCKKDIKSKILVYHGKVSNKQKKEIKEKIKNGDFQVLFTTTNFLYRNFDLFENLIGKFEFIFVDDVDSLLKSAKNIDYILRLLGFSQDDINTALQIIKLKIKLLSVKGKLFEKISKEIKELESKINPKKQKINSILVTSSATAKPKGLKIKLLNELLNFEVGKASTNLRNVVDSYVEDRTADFEKFSSEKLIKILKILKNGILFFLPSDLGKDFVPIAVEKLKNLGFNVESYENLNDEIIEKFRKGEIQILVGIASYRNPLARGIDLPDAIKYAIFWGVPKFIFNANLAENPRALIAVILNLNKVLPDELKKKLERDNKFVGYLRFLNKISIYTKEYINSNEELKNKILSIYEDINQIIETEEVKKILLENDEISFDGKQFIIADVAAYIQASGRTSRMYVGGLTKGLSIVFVDNKKAFNNLQKRMRWFYDDVKFEKLEL